MLCNVSCTARVRSAGVVVRVRSMSSISDEVKQPTSFSTSGWNGSRPNIGRLSRNREPLDHRANAFEYDAATAIAGVNPRRCAAAKSASRVSTSKMCQSRTLRRGSACSANGTSGSAGDSGSSASRSAHHCRSSSEGPGAAAASAARYSAIGVAQFGQFPAAVEHRQVGHELAVTHRVRGVHVHVDVQPRATIRTQRQAQLEHIAVE